MTGGADYGHVGHCGSCNKKLYLSRALAKRAGKRWHPGEHLTPYRCPRNTELWHVGHLQSRVINGFMAKTAAA